MTVIEFSSICVDYTVGELTAANIHNSRIRISGEKKALFSPSMSITAWERSLVQTQSILVCFLEIGDYFS